MIRNRFQLPLKQFLDSSSHFKVVHSTSTAPESSFKRVLILDSSFNPPHLGHYSIIRKSLEHPGFDASVVLLLLSVKNADKMVPKPAAFEDRLNMMCLLANDICKRLNVEVHVGLTKRAKFVDKATSIREHFASDKIYTFLLGFDTLVRILDEKYYRPLSLKESLGEFMKKNELFCLTRVDDKDFDVKEQLLFYDNLKNGMKEPDLPQSWAKSIYMVNGDDKTLHVSSSEIRKAVQESRPTWSDSTLSEIEGYIKAHKLYRETKF